jgi:hypothetical protein
MPMSPQDLANAMPTLFRRSAEAGMSVSAFMERENPSSDYPSEKTDAFGRVLKYLGIRSRSIPSAGVWASTFDVFDKDETHRAIGLEWCLRQWRAAKYGMTANTRAVLSGDELVGSILRPHDDAAGIRQPLYAPQVPLSTFVATETAIQGTTYRAAYLDDSAFDGASYVRLTEAGEIPMASVQTAQEESRLHKHGRGIEWSYEAMREARLDKVALFIAELALRVEEQKVAHVVNLLINGDGNSGTAAEVIDSEDLDATATTSLTLKAYLRFKKRFRAPYRADIILGDEETITELELLPVGTNSMPLIAINDNSAIGALRPLSENQLGTGVGYGVVETVPDKHLLAIDSRFALERISQIGSRVQESERFITRQTEAMVFTEHEGWKVLSKGTNKLLDFSTDDS